MINLFEAKQNQKAALDKAEAILATAERENRGMTVNENSDYNAAMDKFRDFGATVQARTEQNTILAAFKNGMPFGANAVNAPALMGGRGFGVDSAKRLTSEYTDAFYAYVGSNGQKVSAALYEGAGSAGGFTVPVTVEGQVIPLAPGDTGVRSIATVLATANDLKLPRATTISTAAGKAEGDGTGTNVFTESEPQLEQFTLSAFMAGVLHQISWELAQDVPSFQQFAIGDMLLAQQLYEENLYVNGTGTGQAQGLKGNVTAAVTGVTVGSDNYASELLAASFDAMGNLKSQYHPNASWLMARSTAVALRKAQAAANYYFPLITSEGGKWFFHGYPVTFSSSVDAIGAAKTPLYFGDFKQGYVIGDRGGAGVNVKILDQPKALEGILQLLCYRRTDGRIRRSEAIQSVATHS